MWRWILNAIVVLLLIRLALRFLMGLLQGLAAPSSPASSGGRATAGGTRSAGELVQDPVCGTYIPRASAIAVSAGAGTRFYCSEACRDKDRFTTPAMKGRAAHG
jgi:YHS domain-containing protein